MKADPINIGDIFRARKRFIVPIFQRHYVWKEDEQWIPLFEDIQAKARERLAGEDKRFVHYLGAAVLETPGRHTSRTVPVSNVIDGQQRLTTLQIILLVLLHIARENQLDDYIEDIRGFLFNGNERLMENPDTDRFKVWPTRFDRRDFMALMNAENREEIRSQFSQYFPQGLARLKMIGYIPRLLGVYIFFHDRFSEFIFGDGDEEENRHDPEHIFDQLFTAITDDFSIVEIVLDDGDDPQVIFETLNARGTPLLASDLIRNYIFFRCEAEEKKSAEELYDKYWKEFEHPFWAAEQKQGRHIKPRLEFYMGHFLAAQTGKEINLTKLYQEYKHLVESSGGPNSVDDELQLLTKYAPIYATLVEPEGDDFFARFAQRLLDWDITTVYPPVLLIMGAKIPKKDKRQALGDIYSYLVRRAVCRYTAKNYNKLFLSLAKKLIDVGVSGRVVRDFLLRQKGDSGLWPTDEEFRVKWLERPLYSEIKPVGRVRSILEELERANRSSKSESVELKSVLSVEHVMPQEWTRHWKLPGGKKVDELEQWAAQQIFEPKKGSLAQKVQERDRLLNTIGNLTLLTQPLNSSVSNRSYKDKKKALMEHSALALTRYFHGIRSWDEKKIAVRSKVLFKLAKKIWPRKEPG